jgi:hypothetical protein
MKPLEHLFWEGDAAVIPTTHEPGDRPERIQADLLRGGGDERFAAL